MTVERELVERELKVDNGQLKGTPMTHSRPITYIAILGVLLSSIADESAVVRVFAQDAAPSSPSSPPPSPDPASVFESAQRAFAAGDYKSAESGFQEVLKLDPNSAAAYINLGVVYMRTEKLDAAIEALETAKKLAPSMVGIDLNLGLAYYRKKDYSQAIPYFATVLSADPHSLQARYLKGMCHFAADDYAAVVETLEPIASDQQDDLGFLFALAISYGKLNREEDSKKTFAQLVRAGGDSANMHLLMGKAYLDQRQNDKAQVELGKALAGDPKMPFAHFNLGVSYQRLGKLEEAAAEFEQEMAITPDEPWSYENRGTIYLDQGDADHAIAMFEKALALNPKMPLSLAGLGKAYIQKSKPEEAIPYLKRAVDLQSDNSSLHYQLAQAYLKAGLREEGGKELAETKRLQAQVRQSQDTEISGRLPEPQGPH